MCIYMYVYVCVYLRMYVYIRMYEVRNTYFSICVSCRAGCRFEGTLLAPWITV